MADCPILNPIDKPMTETVVPLSHNALDLYLSRTEGIQAAPEKHILLLHGVTYSSHEFDIPYRDYSLVRALVQEGYCVWRLDIAGYGRSVKVEDGFLPDSDFAAQEIALAVSKIVQETGQDRIDLLGWSWGTVTVGRYAARHPEHLRRLVLYAPILCGLGQEDIAEPFHRNTWEHAAGDFQTAPDGSPDPAIADPILVEMWCSSCWHYDGDSSPNGGRRDICVDPSVRLIDLKAIRTPTLVICGDRDPYLDNDLVRACLSDLPAGSALEIIEGGSHAVFVEKPWYREFRKRLFRFLLQ